MRTDRNKIRRRPTLADAAKVISEQDARIILGSLSLLPAERIDMELVNLCADIINGDMPEPNGHDEPRALARLRAALAERAARKGTAARPPRISRRMVVALAIMAVLLLATALASAFGWLPWQRIVWTDRERYYVGIDMTSEMAGEPLWNFLPTGLDDDLDKALEENEILIPLPTWIPEGYGNPKVQVDRGEISTTLFISFSNGEGKYLSLLIDKYVLPSDEESSMQSHAQIEKDDDYFEEYKRGDTVYTLLSNVGWLNAVWSRQPYECKIGGYISAEDMHRMIDSIYERST